MNKRLLRKPGFTLVEVMIVVSIVGILAALAIPKFIRAGEITKENICAVNIRDIEGALNRYNIDYPTIAFDAITMANLVGDYITSEPECPALGTYSWDAAGLADCSEHSS